MESIAQLNERFKAESPEAVMEYFTRLYPGKVAFSTSLGAEDQVLTEMISRMETPPRVFTLDTGRLFAETYDLIALTESRYGLRIEVYFPEHAAVEQLVREKGINLFYHSVENRIRCCHVRKVLPLGRALQGMKVWISGLRRGQSVTRKDLPLVSWDAERELIKLNPLAAFTEAEVWSYIRQHGVPYHPLHDAGFPSLGCQPCTQAVQPGEDVRSGRWWWENPESKECGLHVKDKP